MLSVPRESCKTKWIYQPLKKLLTKKMIHLHKEAHLLVLQEKLEESLKKLAEIEVELDLHPLPKNLQSQDSLLEV